MKQTGLWGQREPGTVGNNAQRFQAWGFSKPWFLHAYNAESDVLKTTLKERSLSQSHRNPHDPRTFYVTVCCVFPSGKYPAGFRRISRKIVSSFDRFLSSAVDLAVYRGSLLLRSIFWHISTTYVYWYGFIESLLQQVLNILRKNKKLELSCGEH